ncbi:MAG: ImmA/IrrE family metallo-endopeptidase, partial [Oscillospiraceae bacterium]
MGSKITSSDIFDINKKSGALILGSNRLDDYATKFLTKYCKEALVTPMPLPVEKIIEQMGLNVQEVSLSNNMDVFGCCLLLDGCVDIFNSKTRQYTSTAFSAGTILIDPLSAAAYGEGSKRNTLIHEVLHWEKDKTYFEILKVKNKSAAEKLYPILCRQSEAFYNPPEGKKTKENEVRWLEWQAHRLAPRVLMPKNSFRKKATDILKESDVIFCSSLIRRLSEYFNVSSESVKYRIIEVGLMDAISELVDYEDVYADIKKSVNSTALTPAQAIQCLNNDGNLRNWVLTGKYIFVDGYFVLDDERFVAETDKGIHLTLKARNNLAKCTVNIREYKNNSFCHSNDG